LTVAAPPPAYTAVALRRWRESSVPKALPPASAAPPYTSNIQRPRDLQNNLEGASNTSGRKQKLWYYYVNFTGLLETSASLDDAFSSLREYAPSPTRTSRQG
jgi:hypothetical protein